MKKIIIMLSTLFMVFISCKMTKQDSFIANYRNTFNNDTMSVSITEITTDTLRRFSESYTIPIFISDYSTDTIRYIEHFVYIDKTGPFTEFPVIQQQVDSLVKHQNIKVGIACGTYLDDPAKIAQQNLNWRVGYIVVDSVKVEEPLNFMTIARDQYLDALIKANPMVAPLRTSPAIHKWLTDNPYDASTESEAYALYHENGVVEVLFPIQKQTE